MRSSKQKTIWWVDHLGLKEAWQIYRQSQKAGYAVEAVRFFHQSSCWGRMAVTILSLRLSTQEIKQEVFDLTHPVDGDNGILFWQAWRDCFTFGWNTACQNSADHLLVDEIDSTYNKENLRLYFKRQIAYEQYRNLQIILLVGHHAKSMKTLHHAVLLDGKQWEENLKSYASNFSYSLHCYVAKSYWKWIGLRYCQFIVKILENCFLFFMLKVKCLLKSASPDSNRSKPKIGVFYAQGINSDRRSDLFWLSQSGVDPQDVVVYFLDPRKPPTAEIISTLKQLGVYYVSLLPRGLNKANINPNLTADYYKDVSKRYLYSLLALVRLFQKLWEKNHLLRVWQYERLMWLLGRTALFEALFESHNIKVHFGFYAEDDQNIMAMDLAMDHQGGVDTYVFWSNLIGPEIMPSLDVHFVWGPHYLYCYKEVGQGIKNFLYSGYPFDGIFDLVLEKAKMHRKRLFNKGARFVICFFDNIYYPGGWFPKEDLINVHKILLKEVKSDKELGLILKPKREESLNKILDKDVKDLIDDLEKEGRILILKGKELPAEASLASDLAIGYGVFNSAAVESALTDTRTIFYDPVNQRFDPFYQNGYGKIIFNDFNSLMMVIKKYREEPAGMMDIGNFSFILDQIDPFRDKKAYWRIGRYLDVLLREISVTGDKQEAINRANQFYREEIGEQYVIDMCEGKSQMLANVY